MTIELKIKRSCISRLGFNPKITDVVCIERAGGLVHIITTYGIYDFDWGYLKGYTITTKEDTTEVKNNG